LPHVNRPCSRATIGGKAEIPSKTGRWTAAWAIEVYEQIQARKMKARLHMRQHAQRVSGNVSQTCRFFGASRSLYYIWEKRFEKKGLDGLRDLKRRPHHIRCRIPPEIVSLILRIREERGYGAIRTSLYLQRHYHA